ncbi:KH domain-containing protein [Demequina capsici]|uniref:RNA-binding protein KhpA n=2 Tax=Demequina TaxID=577469 RepID=A0AA96FAQ8_9MICO|nr:MULTISPECIES: KH domain-containing protein [unclassified Demequina]MDN4473554.1 KH domain-containing protein [Demequina sp. SYSU T00b26]WNM23437.1 KH domain-containing protein [Demequina sp. OYTSA14]WNM26314.1 KH domain-containing protein [Demequina sp. PMTSA13]
MVLDALEFLVRSIVRNPDDVRVTERSGRRGTTLNVVVHPDDLPRVIGRRGRTAQAIRTVVDAVSRDDVRVNIVDVA